MMMYCVLRSLVSTMPNGDPDFNVKELERFFSALAPVLEGFAQRHNLRLEKYYHEEPSWGFLCRHPSGVSVRLRYSAPMKRPSVFVRIGGTTISMRQHDFLEPPAWGQCR